MRRRINRTLLTATAASASLISLSFMAAGAAGAATTAGPLNGPFGGAPIVTDTTCTPSSAGIGFPSDGCARAGYQASGRDFRYAAASIVVPSHIGAVAPIVAVTTGTTTPGEAGGDAAMYVALDDSGDLYDYARVGIMPTCLTTNHAGVCATNSPGPTNASGWDVYASAVVNGVISTTPTFYAAIPQAAFGLGVSVSAYLLPSGNWVRVVITTPPTTTAGVVTPGKTYNRMFAVNSAVYTDAQAVADWTGTGASAIVEPLQPASTSPNTSAYDQFFQGRFTTWNGTKGTFNGKWTVTPFEATNNGLATGTVVTSPGYLWSNTTGYANDSFGVWLRHL